ncbi:hypothetical protein Tco_1374775, partial [Tanacetum coccineum]
TGMAYSGKLITAYQSPDTAAEIIMTKVIKEESKKLSLLEIDEDLFTYDTQLG